MAKQSGEVLRGIEFGSAKAAGGTNSTGNLDLLPDWLDQELWEDFKIFRKQETNAPLGPIAEKRMLRKIFKLHSDGCDVNAAIERSLVNGWKDIFHIGYAESAKAREPIKNLTKSQIEAAARPGESYEQVEARLKRGRV
jgi:hypothetical protein